MSHVLFDEWSNDQCSIWIGWHYMLETSLNCFEKLILELTRETCKTSFGPTTQVTLR
jgi:hypothetical protein